MNESIYELKQYETTTGIIHEFEGYYYYVDKKKMYKKSGDELIEIPLKNSYFIIKNKDNKQVCVSWLKLDHLYLQSKRNFASFLKEKPSLFQSLN